MNRLKKAQAHLLNYDIQTVIDNDTLYVCVGYELQLELSDFEIDFRAKLYDEDIEEDI